jgi:hypothetical protein
MKMKRLILTFPTLRQTALLAMMLAAVEDLPSAAAADIDVGESLKTIANADGSVQTDGSASAAVKRLQTLPSSQVGDVLAGFDNASKRGRNWLRALAADVSDNGPFPKESLLQFFANRGNDADARYVAYQLLAQNDDELGATLLENAESDPSLPIRYLRIRSLIDMAKSIMNDQPTKAETILRQVVANGRSPKQLETATQLLSELKVPISLADELGMMRRWWLIGPFDNTDSECFDVAYPPENRYVESGTPIARARDGAPKAEPGRGGPAEWQRIESEDELGMVDLNKPLSNEKDAVAYAYSKFVVDDASASSAQIRIGCITANKVWVNGKLVSSNRVYHSGTRIDQYIDDCELVAGENTVLIKVLQNAQTQPWAQDWQFQFRLTRPDGSAIHTTPVN